MMLKNGQTERTSTVRQCRFEKMSGNFDMPQRNEDLLKGFITFFKLLKSSLHIFQISFFYQANAKD